MSTSVSTSTRPTTARSASRQARTARRWILIATTVVLLLVGLIVVRTQGFVSGSEFSPTHFQLRKFSFYEIPLIHLQITPINRTGTTPKAATYIRQKSLVQTPTGPPQEWHLVTISRGMTGQTPADAQLLIEQLQLQTSAGDEYWRTWSIDHPQNAQVLWATVQTLAQRELYILMPQLFELAQSNQSLAEFRRNLDQYLLRQYRDLILDMEAANRPELAQQLLAEASQDYPEDAELEKLRQRILTSAQSPGRDLPRQ